MLILRPGGASYETGFCPHGVSYEVFKQATEADLQPMRVHEGTIGINFLSCYRIVFSCIRLQRLCLNPA